MKKSLLVLAGAFAGLLGSCSSNEEVKSRFDFIESFIIAGIEGEIKDNLNLVYIWTEASNYEALIDSLINKREDIKVSPGASYSTSESSWTEGLYIENKYTVTAENGNSRNYSVQIDTVIPKKYSFEIWSYNNGYYIPSGPNSRWTSGNAGISIALGILGIDNKNPENYPTKKTAKGYNGSNGVLMETIRGGRVAIKDVPLFSGNFILGNFNRGKAMEDELAATEIGKIYFGKPKSIKGYYKYKEGPGDFERNGVPEPGTIDSCSMNVRFYQSDSPSSGRDTILTVRDMDTSSLVIASASKIDCSETKDDEGDSDGFHPFELLLEYTGEHLKDNHRYKLGMTFAASKYGDSYSGKIGSTLIVDEIEIIDYDEE